MQNLKEKLSKLSVLVFGDMYLDKDCIGEFSGISREDQHLPILKIHKEKYQPGGGGNLASCFAALGVKTTVVGLWSNKNDINRQIIEQSFKNKGIDTSYMVQPGKTLVFGKFYTTNGNHVFRYDTVAEGMTDEAENSLIKNLKQASLKANFLACADYDESGTRDMVCEKTLQPIKETKLPIFATGRKAMDKFKGSNYILLNEHEFEGQPFKGSFEEFVKSFNVSSLIITSKNGATAFNKDGSKNESKAKALEGPLDTCGCGDMFYAMYASSLMAGYDTETSLKLAHIAAGIVAKKMFGADQASIDEVLNNLQT